jgi:hypothetical protein
MGGDRAGTKRSLASTKNNGQEKKHPLSRIRLSQEFLFCKCMKGRQTNKEF